eukprot:TRINITY_DN27071_c0_g1_i1.p1 TRINITY_DN27071_c0_g1~~TRINITY_DN27071_c0_g1_i1.p1  ORF type:complete len:139 (+),score=11.24 TRINITY_DN27071_c0_g1_i1:133-549(+)
MDCMCVHCCCHSMCMCNIVYFAKVYLFFKSIILYCNHSCTRAVRLDEARPLCQAWLAAQQKNNTKTAKSNKVLEYSIMHTHLRSTLHASSNILHSPTLANTSSTRTHTIRRVKRKGQAAARECWGEGECACTRGEGRA